MRGLDVGGRQLRVAETTLHWCEVTVRRWRCHYQKTLLAGAPFLVKSGTRDRTPICTGCDRRGIRFGPQKGLKGGVVPLWQGRSACDWWPGVSVTPPRSTEVFMACAMHLLLLVTLNGKTSPLYLP